MFIELLASFSHEIRRVAPADDRAQGDSLSPLRLARF
jgi:hypothetical protein